MVVVEVTTMVVDTAVAAEAGVMIMVVDTVEVVAEVEVEVRRLATHAPIRLCFASSVVDPEVFTGHSWIHEWFTKRLSVSYGIDEIVE